MTDIFSGLNTLLVEKEANLLCYEVLLLFISTPFCFELHQTNYYSIVLCFTTEGMQVRKLYSTECHNIKEYPLIPRMAQNPSL